MSTTTRRSSLITAESRREYLSLPSVVRWHQSTSDVEIHVRLPRGASEKKGDVSVSVTSTSIRVRLRGHDWGTKKEPLAGTLFRRIKRDESSWTSVRKRHAFVASNEPLTSLLSFYASIDDAQQDADELYFCLRKDRDVVWESIFDDDTAYRKLPHEILKDMVDADEGAKKKPYEELSLESKLLVEEMRERMGMLARNEISMEDLEGETFVLGDPC